MVRDKTKFNQWINSDSVIEWFNQLDDKDTLSFIQFDICEYYHSISENLLKKAINFAGRLTKITNDEKKIIYQARKTILCSNGYTWIKKANKDFDVPMGSWDGAEICDLVGLYLLSQLGHLGFQGGLYRDDGLLVSALNPQELENLKKVKLNYLALKMTKTWLFSLETGKHNNYLYFHVAYLYIQCRNWP